MPNLKITQLTPDTTPTADDLIIIVNDPGGVPTNRKATIANLFAANKLSALAATTSAELAGVISNETGTGALVFAESPTLVSPALGTPASAVLTNATGLPTAGHVDASVTGVKLSATAGSKSIVREGKTIATAAGATNEYIIAPEAGSLTSVEINPLDALAANDTNYITWTVVNLGQNGAGSTAMLAVDNANTTKATGGTALAVNTKRTLTIHGTEANLVVAQGDKIQIVATVSGTLANTVTVPIYILRFKVTT